MFSGWCDLGGFVRVCHALRFLCRCALCMQLILGGWDGALEMCLWRLGLQAPLSWQDRPNTVRLV